MKSFSSHTQKLKSFFKENNISTPSYHFILGSGYQKAFNEVTQNSKDWEFKGKISFKELGFQASTALGHKGEFHYYSSKDVTICFQLGRLHLYEGYSPLEVTSPLICSFLVGVKNFILTNASGGLDPSKEVGSVMMIEDQMNFTGESALVGLKGFEEKELNEILFTDLSEVYNKDFSNSLKSYLEKQDLSVFKGVYIGVKGPQFETPSEVRAFGQLGAQAVGMSTVVEAILLKYLKANVAGCSLVSNLACGLTKDPLDHFEILKQSETSAAKIITAFLNFSLKEAHAH